jgi:hypothetical protein
MTSRKCLLDLKATGHYIRIFTASRCLDNAESVSTYLDFVLICLVEETKVWYRVPLVFKLARAILRPAIRCIVPSF